MREELKRATACVHTRLDDAAGRMPLCDEGGYGEFLAAQYRARASAEAALAAMPAHAMPALPSQLAHLASDLAELDAAIPTATEDFALDTPYEALGASWVLSGSSMGNRAMLVQRRKAGACGPERFLSSTDLSAYFRQLLEVLQQPFDARQTDETIAGARKTFALFERAFAHRPLEIAA